MSWKFRDGWQLCSGDPGRQRLESFIQSLDKGVADTQRQLSKMKRDLMMVCSPGVKSPTWTSLTTLTPEVVSRRLSPQQPASLAPVSNRSLPSWHRKRLRLWCQRRQKLPRTPKQSTVLGPRIVRPWWTEWRNWLPRERFPRPGW